MLEALFGRVQSANAFLLFYYQLVNALSLLNNYAVSFNFYI